MDACIFFFFTQHLTIKQRDGIPSFELNLGKIIGGYFHHSQLPVNRDGNAAGGGRKMGSSFPPRMVLSYPIPTQHDGENFLTPSLPLGAPQSPTPPRKTLLFVNLSYNQYNFFNETYFINKNILKIIIKFIPSNQINFQKKKN